MTELQVVGFFNQNVVYRNRGYSYYVAITPDGLHAFDVAKQVQMSSFKHLDDASVNPERYAFGVDDGVLIVKIRGEL